MEQVTDVLKDRGAIYGSFEESSNICCGLFHAALHLYPFKSVSTVFVGNFHIAGKISRLYKTPNHEDSWLDIAGYSKLIADSILSKLEVERAIGGSLQYPEVDQENLTKDLLNLMEGGDTAVIYIATKFWMASMQGTKDSYMELAQTANDIYAEVKKANEVANGNA